MPFPSPLVVKNGSKMRAWVSASIPEAGVGHDEHDVRAGLHRRVSGGVLLVDVDVARLDRQLPAVGHGVARVDGEVHDDLLELTRIGFDASQSGLQRRHQDDVLADQSPQHVVHLRDDGVEVEDPRLEHLLPAEGEELAGEGGGALRRLEDLAPPSAAARSSRDQAPQDDVAVADDDAEDVVEVVGDAAGQPADRLHLLRLAELLLQPLRLGDVAAMPMTPMTLPAHRGRRLVAL